MEFDINKLIDTGVSTACLAYFLRLVLMEVVVNLKTLNEKVVEIVENTRKCSK